MPCFLQKVDGIKRSCLGGGNYQQLQAKSENLAVVVVFGLFQIFFLKQYDCFLNHLKSDGARLPQAKHQFELDKSVLYMRHITNNLREFSPFQIQPE